MTLMSLQLHTGPLLDNTATKRTWQTQQETLNVTFVGEGTIDSKGVTSAVTSSRLRSQAHYVGGMVVSTGVEMPTRYYCALPP